MKRKPLLLKLTFLIFCIFLISSKLAWSDMSSAELRKKFSLPSKEWKLGKGGKGEKDFLSFNHKKLEEGLAIDARMDFIPMDAKVYLVEIRKQLAEDKKTYKDAQISQVELKNIEAKDWQMFKIVGSDGLTQELWTRKISPLQVMLFTFTSFGDAFNSYYTDFQKVIKQASQF